jgi:phosphoribosylformylglycinamidine synthase PurS subunit
VTFEVFVEVRLRPGIADPEGSTIERTLPALGFSGITGVRVGKAIRFAMEAADEAVARQRADDLCQRLLANPVLEEARVQLVPATPGPG